VVHLSKNTESVIDFTYQVAEIGYQEIAITATRARTARFILPKSR